MKTLRIIEREEPCRPIIIPTKHIKYIKRGLEDRTPPCDLGIPVTSIYVVFLDGECIDGFFPKYEDPTIALEAEND